MKKLSCLLLVGVLLVSLLGMGSLAESSAISLKGDANGDKTVSLKDVLVMRRHLANMATVIDLAAADINGDTSVNMKDILLLRRYLAGLLPSLDGTTTAESESTATATTTTSTCATTTVPTQAPEPHLQYDTAETFGSLGVWWWNANLIVNETSREQRLDFLQQNHVTEIYLWVGSQTNAQLATFIRAAASRGMRVAWLSGDVSWIWSGNTGFDRTLARFQAYQESAEEDAKFYGIHLDVEPHQAGSTPENWQLYADLVVRATAAAHEIGTVIEWDIPFWLDSMTVTVNGEETSLLTLLAECSDTLTLMAYRDTAAAILDISRQELPLGSTYHCKIVLGVETYSEEGTHVSFMEDGKKALYDALQTVLTALSEKDTLDAGYGCAVHYVENWMKLKNE